MEEIHLMKPFLRQWDIILQMILIIQAMKAYNGSNDDAERYRLVTMKYYEAFKNYNSSCGE